MFVFFLGLHFCNRNIIFDSNLRCRKVAKLEMMAKTWSNYHSGHTFSTVFFFGLPYINPTCGFFVDVH